MTEGTVNKVSSCESLWIQRTILKDPIFSLQFKKFEREIITYEKDLENGFVIIDVDRVNFGISLLQFVVTINNIGRRFGLVGAMCWNWRFGEFSIAEWNVTFKLSDIPIKWRSE